MYKFDGNIPVQSIMIFSSKSMVNDDLTEGIKAFLLNAISLNNNSIENVEVNLV